jgi:hypothetical protein
MEHSCWVQRASRMPFQDSMMCTSSLFFPTVESSSLPRRKSDIENEHLPPELFDTKEAKAFLALRTHSQSLPEAPSPGDLSLTTSGSIEVSIAAALSSASLASSQSQSSMGGPLMPTSQTSLLSKMPFWGQHGRPVSLGRRGRVGQCGDGVWRVQFL